VSERVERRQVKRRSAMMPSSPSKAASAAMVHRDSAGMPAIPSNWTRKLQVAVLPAASVAVQVVVVVPTGNALPLGGVQAVVTPGQLSLAAGGGKVTIVVCVVVCMLMFAGHVIEGGCVSKTVVVNVQLGPAVVLQVMVVVPTGKNDPDGGEQVTVPQAPPVVGAG
jgi:hypothetical protein